MNTQTYVSIPADTQAKFTKLAELLDQASQLIRELGASRALRNEPPASRDFWQEVAELQEAFSDLNEHQIDKLINQAVQAVRAEKHAFS